MNLSRLKTNLPFKASIVAGMFNFSFKELAKRRAPQQVRIGQPPLLLNKINTKVIAFIAISAILLSSTYATAQELDTTKAASLFGSGGLSHNGGYGAPEVKFYPGAGVGGVLWTGGRGGWIINRTFSIGGAGYGLVVGDKFPVVCPTHPGQTEGKLTAGYGGLYFEYINSSNDLLHFTANLLVGVGGATYRHPNFELDDDIESPLVGELTNHPDSWMFVVEPGIAVDLNIAEFFRLSAGVGYRFVPNLDLSYKDAAGATQRIVEDDVFNGVSINLTFKFGKF